ncbi:MarR family transcriptional regulator [Kineosporia mesophila]|uniref:MarR family transcriptional regulator n=1 Tax=Kineosporia mesophila TaxID=566012 RepID=A0ABP7AQG4_9ACTN|nr:MarR family transcriptional regulator [Kineosporia mesophila]
MTPDDPLLDALVQNTFRVTAVLTRVGAEHDLSLTQLRVLGILRDRRARMSELAAFLGLDKSTLSGLIDRAEKRGLLAREKSPGDRRVIEVFTTTAGLELAGTVYAEIRRELSPSMDRLDPQQRDQLTALMGVLLEHF